MEELSKNFPEGIDYSIVYDPTLFVRASIEAVVRHALRGAAAGGARGDPLPADLARLDHPARRGAGVAGRHLRGDEAASASRSTRSRSSAWCWPSASWSTTPSWWSRTSSATSRSGCRRARPRARAMDEVTGPIIAIALVLCAVFVPIGFISGLTGQFYKQFALTIAISTVISAFNSLTLSPALAAVLLRGARRAEGSGSTRVMDRALGWFFRPFNRFFDAASGALRRRGAAACSAGPASRWSSTPACSALTWVGFSKVPDRLRADAGQAVPRRLRPAARRRLARSHRRRHPAHVGDRARDRASSTPSPSPACRSPASPTAPTPASSSSA